MPVVTTPTITATAKATIGDYDQNVQSYCWTRGSQGRRIERERAEQHNGAETLYLSSGKEACGPNESSYNACIKAHVKNGVSNINRKYKYSK
jgi:hypothetical protein